jgi:exonuclease III
LTIEVIGKFLKPFLITTWYRPPANEASILDNFENYLQSLEKEDKESIILGDFICNMLETQKNPLNTTKLVSWYDEYQYNQLIKESTRVTKSSKSLIDHVTITVLQRVRKSGVCHLSISDHNLIYAVRRMVMPHESDLELSRIETINLFI